MTMPGFSTLVVATRNDGKLRELRTLLRPMQCEVLNLKDVAILEDIDETGNTFEENARLKALEYSRLTRFPVLADDSGLEVEALEGRPGVHSARYAGPGASDSERIQKLLQEIRQTGDKREARFVCVLALAQDGKLIREARGECSGTIIDEPRGSNGFGYDPVFLFPRLGKTFAELNEEEKNQYSHRARAAAALIRQLH